MSKYKSLLRRERIAAVAAEVVDQLARLLALAGVTIRAKVQQSKRTGSVYLKIKVLDAAGEKLKDCGVAIRISDHDRYFGLQIGGVSSSGDDICMRRRHDGSDTFEIFDGAALPVESDSVNLPFVARMLGVSERTIYLLTQSGQIPHKRVAGRILYPIDALRRFVNETDPPKKQSDRS